MISRWVVALTTGLAVVAALSSSAAAAAATRQATGNITIWVQTMDSCRHALPGASQTVHGANVSFTIGPSAGTKPAGVGSSPCPAPRGSCVVTNTGCTSFTVPVPSTAPVTYKITQSAAQAAPNTVPCNGGSACRGQSATFTVSTAGVVQARTTNIYPDGRLAFYPSSTGFAAGTKGDPILFHDFVLGTKPCDGDNDADDQLTGSPSSHCDSDSDRSSWTAARDAHVKHTHPHAHTRHTASKASA